MTSKPAPRFWHRCRSCGHSRASDWPDLPADLTGTACNSCGSEEITLYELATRAALRLPRPLIPPVQRYTCCHCGGTGLDSLANTCPACLGAGFC
ncbi:hypothetical protein ACSNOI_39300 [Actinomadura kijaniata]|uniref:hypothetical protein n=1 Tax=Actinomadura kijaniata TaxID=46161 RepID=UPI003F1E3661